MPPAADGQSAGAAGTGPPTGGGGGTTSGGPGGACWSHSRGTYPSGTGPGGRAGGPGGPGAAPPGSVSVIDKTLPVPAGAATCRGTPVSIRNG